MNLAAYYESLSNEEFYTSAANFWRYRACLYGNQAAIQWKKDWFREKTEVWIPVAVNPDFGYVTGAMLRALGFEFFDRKRAYTMDYKDKNGVIEIRSGCGTSDPDEDGFGMEELYDWWFVDEHLQPIPGARVLKGWSRNERWTSPEQYELHRKQAAEFLRVIKYKEIRDKVIKGKW